MKKLTLKGFLSVTLLMIVGAFAIASCDDDNVEKPKVITEVSLDKANLSLTEGETATLVATLSPKGSKDAISWSSDNTQVATVSSSGEVKAVAEGSATITASLKNGNKATCKVTVAKKQAQAEENKTTISLDHTKASIKMGETLALKVTLAPENAKDKITWSSSKEAVAKVDDKGVVTAVAEGEAVITASLENGNKATCTITVTKQEEAPAPAPTPGTGDKATVKFKQETYTINVGETKDFNQELLISMGKDPNETVSPIRFNTFDEDVISIKDGVAKGLKAGEAELDVSLPNGEYATCTITVKGGGVSVEIDPDPSPVPPAKKEVKITPSSLNMMEGDQTQLHFEYLGGLTPAEVTLTSKDPDVATVTNAGLVTAKKSGETYIYVYINGVQQHHYIPVTVNEAVKKGKYTYVIRHVKKDVITEKDAFNKPLEGEYGKKVINDEFVTGGSSSMNTLYVVVDVTDTETNVTTKGIANRWETSPIPGYEDDYIDYMSQGIYGSVMYPSHGKFNLHIKLDQYGIDETVKVFIKKVPKKKKGEK